MKYLYRRNCKEFQIQQQYLSLYIYFSTQHSFKRSSVDKDISTDEKENFHEFLRSAKNTFTQNVYRTKDSTYNLLKPLQRNKDIVLLSGDKDSSVVVLDKACYNEKINRLIKDDISKGVYVIEENDNTLTELKSFQNFIYRNFKKHEKYKEMSPTSS